MMTNEQNAVVVLTTGKQDRGTRATLALSWACSTLALGRKTSIFLTMDGTVWAMDGAMKGIQVEGFEPLVSYLEQFRSLGGRVLVCAPCTKYYCSINGNKTNGRLLDGAQLVGLATVVSDLGPNSIVVTF
ncbi:MAG: DsrE family protein [Candidatus Eisenbacteria bacterium]|nr:DsrE family protein [Candidatus Eisenbacteria bacterium]